MRGGKILVIFVGRRWKFMKLNSRKQWKNRDSDVRINEKKLRNE
jgi:hypothetical protein